MERRNTDYTRAPFAPDRKLHISSPQKRLFEQVLCTANVFEWAHQTTCVPACCGYYGYFITFVSLRLTSFVGADGALKGVLYHACRSRSPFPLRPHQWLFRPTQVSMVYRRLYHKVLEWVAYSFGKGHFRWNRVNMKHYKPKFSQPKMLFGLAGGSILPHI